MNHDPSQTGCESYRDVLGQPGVGISHFHCSGTWLGTLGCTFILLYGEKWVSPVVPNVCTLAWQVQQNQQRLTETKHTVATLMELSPITNPIRLRLV